MNRKRTLYLAIAAVALAVLLVLLGIYNIWIMLVTLLFIVIAAGLLYKEGGDIPVKVNDIHSGERKRLVSPPTLVLVREGAGKAEQIVVNKPEFTIGRDPACDYVIQQHQYISGVHAIIHTGSKGSCAYITDNHSHNGIFINNSRIAPDQPVQISVGDVIQLGSIRLIVQMAHI